MSDYQYEQARDDQRRQDDQRENARIFDEVTQRQLDTARAARDHEDGSARVQYPDGSTPRGTVPFPDIYPGGRRPSPSPWSSWSSTRRNRENEKLFRDIRRTTQNLKKQAGGAPTPNWWKRNHVVGWLAGAAAAVIAAAVLAEDQQKPPEPEAAPGADAKNTDAENAQDTAAESE